NELLEMFSLEGDGSLGRLAYGSAACELLYLLLPEEENQESLYVYFLTYLRKLSTADKRTLPSVFIAFFLRLMSQLGYHPSLAYCCGCSSVTNHVDEQESRVLFSPERGGVVCSSCQKPGEYYISLSGRGLQVLRVLQRASLDEAASLRLSFSEASLLVDTLTKFLRFHSGLISDLRSLEFLEKLRNTELT
ncbi:MAG: DNA repair protein RecO, partial [candidate division Zixibacteria bacterium]|nr:DNA repair protein RecO [candidate division Zixibacteria bacterium]